MKHCNHCDRDLPLECFHERYKGTGRLQSMCKECRRAYDHEFHKRKREEYLPKKRARRQGITKMIADWKSTLSCTVCGESETCCLDFHHIDPAEKEFSLANNQGRSFERMLEEAKKCVVLCSNCHRKVHAGKITIGV